MKKTKTFWYMLNSIFVIVFNLYFFLLKDLEQHNSVWISFGSIHFAYLMFLLTPYFVRKGSTSADYGRPLFAINIGYFFLALIVGIVFIAISPESITVTLLVQVTIAAVFAIILLTNLIANEHTAESIERRELELKYVKEASSKLDALGKQISDNANRKKVENAYDLIRSSQTKSSGSVEFLEREVMSQISKLEALIKQNRFDEIEDAVNQICQSAEERNRQLKILN